MAAVFVQVLISQLFLRSNSAKEISIKCEKGSFHFTEIMTFALECHKVLGNQH